MLDPTSIVPTPESFDYFPYPSYAHSQTHPDNLATLGMMSGINPPPVNDARILELGCASGGNLIPMAYSLPGSEFVGLDFSGRAVFAGNAHIARLGLGNISLHHDDILSVGFNYGTFDYIIAHGIFSWVPYEVQEKIFQICRENLSPNGIAYISYNVYPGWHMFKVARDAMLFHTRHLTDDHERMKAAREIVDILSGTLTNESDPQTHVHRMVQMILNESVDGYIRHDFMAEVNDPCYFVEFVERAKLHGLQFMANAELNSPGSLPAEAYKTVFSLTDDIVEAEQYLDFLRNRTFRQTLLCHQNIPVRRDLDADCLAGLWVATQMKSGSFELDPSTAEPEEVLFEGGTNLTLHDPLTKASLLVLASLTPGALRYEELIERALSLIAEKGGDPPEQDQLSHQINIMGANLLWLNSENRRIARFHTFIPHFVDHVSERPIASATARLEAGLQLPIYNMYFQRVTLGEFVIQLLPFLDGTRDRAALMENIRTSVEIGTLELAIDDKPITDPDLAESYLQDVLENVLNDLAQVALLVG